MTFEAVLRHRRRQRDVLLERAHGFVSAIEARYSIRAAVVFGSVARGDFNLWSDIDLLLVTDEIGGNALERLDALGQRPPLVQPIVWTTAEWRSQLQRGNPIAREVLDLGVWIRGSSDETRGWETGGGTTR
jgi:uncharacterized protein